MAYHQRVDTGESGALWQAAQAAMVRFDRARGRKDVEGIEVALADVQHLLTQGVADYAMWREIDELIDQRRRLVESEQRRLTLAHEILSQDRAMALMGQVVDILRRHVRDRDVLGAIARDMQAIGHRSNGHSAAVD
jgi:hypothetical protein